MPIQRVRHEIMIEVTFELADKPFSFFCDPMFVVEVENELDQTFRQRHFLLGEIFFFASFLSSKALVTFTMRAPPCKISEDLYVIWGSLAGIYPRFQISIGGQTKFARGLGIPHGKRY